MTAYADYTYYTQIFFGRAISEEDFPRMALMASQYLDYITQGKAQKHPELDSLKLACCAIAENYQTIEAAQALANKSLAEATENEGLELQSQTVGGWSRSFRSGGESARDAAQMVAMGKGTLWDTARLYLAHTGLLYRGGRRCR